jgi:hypothetical protein
MADHQEKYVFPVEVFLTAYSCRWAIRKLIPDGFCLFLTVFDRQEFSLLW